MHVKNFFLVSLACTGCLLFIVALTTVNNGATTSEAAAVMCAGLGCDIPFIRLGGAGGGEEGGAGDQEEEE